MSFAVDTIIDTAQRRYPDMSDTIALEHFNTSRGYLMSQLHLRRTSIDITLTASTYEYALNAAVFAVDSARYVRSATRGDYKTLLPISLSELEALRQDWRKLADGEPSNFYLFNGTAGPMVGLTPFPATTTASGYPKVTLECNQNLAMIAGETIYDDMPNAKVYVYGICKEYAEEKDRENLGYWDELFNRELNRVQGYLFKKNQQLSTRMQPAHMSRRLGVI